MNQLENENGEFAILITYIIGRLGLFYMFFMNGYANGSWYFNKSKDYKSKSHFKYLTMRLLLIVPILHIYLAFYLKLVSNKFINQGNFIVKDICQKTIWANLLFVSNLFNPIDNVIIYMLNKYHDLIN